MQSFERVFQPRFEDVFGKDHPLKGKWNQEVFHNNNPITLELGCGKGEYTVNLGGKFPGRNFIGIDIKGARIWRGAKTANEQGLQNVAFLRTRIELINSFFGPGEVEEIWITFPDPQLKKRRNKKRLTGSRFLNSYRKFLTDCGTVHLKTDNDVLYRYTSDLVAHNQLPLVMSSGDLYASDIVDEILSIRTFYESQFLKEGSSIHYIAFNLPGEGEIGEPPSDET